MILQSLFGIKMSVRTSLVKRFDELIKRGKELPVLSIEPPSEDLAKLEAWETACLHLVDKTFGEESVYYEKLSDAFDVSNIEVHGDYGVAIMEGAKEEIEKGFLYKIEHLIAVDLFDSILERAEYLLDGGFKDAAAILGRVVIENSLKDIAKRENIALPENVKLSKLNEILWKEDIYAKNVWRITQGYIDMGNFAAHGDFDKYNEQSVKDMLKWVRETLLSL